MKKPDSRTIERMTPANDAEKELLRAVKTGWAAKISTGLDPKDPTVWRDEHTIRADFLCHICLHPDVYDVNPGGINMRGAFISGQLNFLFYKAPYPLGFIGCRFGEVLNLMHAHMSALALVQCHLPGLKAFGLKLAGPFIFTDSMVAGETRLLGADIAGQLECTGATFVNEGGMAFTADYLKVGGSVLLKKFTATGETRLLGANITGQLDCTGATFTNEGGVAFIADGLKAGVNVLFDNITATGETRLVGADIAMELNCTGSTFTNENGKALNADRLKVGGNVSLDNITVTGEACLLGAHITGQLNCTGSTFTNKRGAAFMAQGLKVTDGIIWRGLKSSPVGWVDFRFAQVRVLADDAAAWPEGQSIINGFVYERFETHIPAEERIAWLHKMPEEWNGEPVFYPQPYEQAIKVIKDTIHENEARKVAIAKQDYYVSYLKRMQVAHIRNSRLYRAWMGILKYTAGYGYETWRALIGAAFFIAVLGWSIFGGAAYSGHMKPAKERIYMAQCYTDRSVKGCEFWVTKSLSGDTGRTLNLPPDYPIFSAFWYSLDVFVPILDLHQEDYWLPDEGQYRSYMWLHIIAGWVLTTIAVAGFAGILKKAESK